MTSRHALVAAGTAGIFIVACGLAQEREPEVAPLTTALVPDGVEGADTVVETTAIRSGADVRSSGGSCPSDMVEVKGTYCTKEEYRCRHDLSGGSETKVESSEGGVPYFCDEYEPGYVKCNGEKKPMHYCVDRYESQNVKGELPDRFVTWTDAKKLCADRGKRLCYEEEWTLACEGPEHRPYPYGWRRDTLACNQSRCYDQPGVVGKSMEIRPGAESYGEYLIGTSSSTKIALSVLGRKRGDKVKVERWPNTSECRITEIRYLGNITKLPNAVADNTLLRMECTKVTCADFNPKEFAGIEVDPKRLPAELERLDQLSSGRARKRSGEMESCVSGYGVHDMSGNVDEWVECRGACDKFPSYLKGGHWLGLVRNRCHPVTTHHGPSFRMYPIGYRCCKDAD